MAWTRLGNMTFGERGVDTFGEHGVDTFGEHGVWGTWRGYVWGTWHGVDTFGEHGVDTFGERDDGRRFKTLKSGLVASSEHVRLGKVCCHLMLMLGRKKTT